MNYKMMGRFLSQVLTIEGVFMVPALVISLFARETGAVRGFLMTLAAIALLALFLRLVCRSSPSAFYAREGLVCVGMSWIVLSAVGCLPFYISREIPRYIDCFFEMVSGFTTTGSSILSDVESLSSGILYWRSFSHWLGGMGVLVFLLAFTPSDNQGAGFTMHLLRAESPGPDVGKMTPKLRTTAVILYGIYVALTALDFVLLLLGGMTPLDAICTAFGTAGTGGFGVRNDSLASFSPYLQNVTTIFMLLFGINFTCYYLILIGQAGSVFKDEELRLFLGLFVVCAGLIALNVRGLYNSWEETFRHSAFQVATIISTTGYATTDFDLWPAFSKGLLMLLMIVGSCAGSTAGGLKLSRLLLLLKSLGRNIRQVLSPRKVERIRINGRVVSEAVLDNANAYLAAYFLIVVVVYLIISLDGFSVGTNLTAALACFNNIGPGLEQVGPTCNFSQFSTLSKLTLSLAMLAGRLEIFPILILFSKDTWVRR